MTVVRNFPEMEKWKGGSSLESWIRPTEDSNAFEIDCDSTFFQDHWKWEPINQPRSTGRMIIRLQGNDIFLGSAMLDEFLFDPPEKVKNIYILHSPSGRAAELSPLVGHALCRLNSLELLRIPERYQKNRKGNPRLIPCPDTIYRDETNILMILVMSFRGGGVWLANGHNWRGDITSLDLLCPKYPTAV
ncbi:MAG: hypothetical protein JWO00_423 [Candidatus Parcubacteria bacterium]|nr:hypothetical protein [Candidatus Parcubacteria bacterium]